MLEEGLYEQVISKELEKKLNKNNNIKYDASAIDNAEAPAVLSRYVAEIVQKGLTMVQGDGISEQLGLVNKIISVITEATGDEVCQGVREMMKMQKTPEQISYNMRQVRCKGSKIEVMLMKELWARGLRYRKNVKTVCGKPDIAFIGKKVAVFCDSEFWHGYNWEERKKDFKSNQEFWIPKIERNIDRDKEVTEQLEADGWTVLRFWGNDIKKNLSECADIIEKTVKQYE